MLLRELRLNHWRFKARTHGVILSEFDCVFYMRFCEIVNTVWLQFVCICIEVYLELHITIAQNGCGNQSCAMSHTKNPSQSHHVNSIIYIHTTYIACNKKKRSRIHNKSHLVSEPLSLKSVCRIFSFSISELRLKARPVSWNKNWIENNLKKAKEV